MGPVIGLLIMIGIVIALFVAIAWASRGPSRPDLMQASLDEAKDAAFVVGNHTI